MATTADISVAVFDNHGGVYKHWAVFIDGPTEKQKILLQVEGSMNRFRLEREYADARDSDKLVELIPVCTVPASRISDIDKAAGEAPIHNLYPGYNCQDYVVDLLETLEELELIDGHDAKYIEQMALLLSKQEGRD